MRDLRGRLATLEEAAKLVIKQIGRETMDETQRRWEAGAPGRTP